jgi:hypothetical protein
MLKPQDILVLLKLLSPDQAARQNYAALGESVGLSGSETHAAVRRALRSALLVPLTRHPESLSEIRPSTSEIAELLCYGVPYFLPGETGRIVLGIPTGESAPPLSTMLAATDAPPHVWLHPRGTIRGVAVEPIYHSAPDAALRDPALAEWLALTDALRLHTGRIAELARNEVRRRLRDFSHAAAA